MYVKKKIQNQKLQKINIAHVPNSNSSNCVCMHSPVPVQVDQAGKWEGFGLQQNHNIPNICPTAVHSPQSYNN